MIYFTYKGIKYSGFNTWDTNTWIVGIHDPGIGGPTQGLKTPPELVEAVKMFHSTKEPFGGLNLEDYLMLGLSNIEVGEILESTSHLFRSVEIGDHVIVYSLHDEHGWIVFITIGGDKLYMTPEFICGKLHWYFKRAKFE